MTSLTTLLALLALYIFGGEVVRGFVSAMMWGVLIGTYSSIFIASPLIALLGFKIIKQVPPLWSQWKTCLFHRFAFTVVSF